MGLAVGDHLQAVLDRPQAVVAFAEQRASSAAISPRAASASSAARVPRSRSAGLAPAVDQLVGLGEELDLADPAAPALDVEPRPGARGPPWCGADARGQPADLLDRPEIEVAAPHERADRAREIARPRRRRPPHERARMKAARSHASAELS